MQEQAREYVCVQEQVYVCVRHKRTACVNRNMISAADAGVHALQEINDVHLSQGVQIVLSMLYFQMHACMHAVYQYFSPKITIHNRNQYT